MTEKIIEARLMEIFCRAYIGKIRENKRLFYTKESFDVLNKAIDACSSTLAIGVLEQAFDYMENEMGLF